jgi:hypothetical protein
MQPPPNLPQNSEKRILGEASYFMEEIIGLFRVSSIDRILFNREYDQNSDKNLPVMQEAS